MKQNNIAEDIGESLFDMAQDMSNIAFDALDTGDEFSQWSRSHARTHSCYTMRYRLLDAMGEFRAMMLTSIIDNAMVRRTEISVTSGWIPHNSMFIVP